MISCEDIGNDFKTKYTALAQAMPMGLLLLNLAGEVVEVNQTAIVIFGASSIDSVKNINMITNSDIKATGISELILKCIDSRYKQVGMFEYKTIWNKDLQLKITCSPVIDDTKSVCYVLVICEDLTDSELMKKKNWRLSRTLAKIVDSIHSHAIWAKDERGVFQMVNQEYADMFGLTPMDIVGKTDWDFFPVEQCQHYSEDDQIVLTTCGQLEIEEDVFDPRYNANRKWRTIKSAVCDEKGAGVVVVGIGEDVTEEFNRREAAKVAIKELEAFVKRCGKGTGDPDGLQILYGRDVADAQGKSE